MKIKKIQEYKLEGERNVSSRKPLIIDEKLYVPFIFDKKGMTASRIICFDKNNFETLWNFDYPFVINNILKSTANNLLVSCMDGVLQELDPNNGNSVNSYKLEMERNGHSSAIEEDKIVFGGVQGTETTNCFDLISHEIKWSFDNGGHSYVPLISNGKVYQCTERNIRCLDLDSGDLIWEAYEDTTYIFNPVKVKDAIVVGGHGLINFYNSQNGTLLHQIKTDVAESIRAIICENDIIYFGDSSGNFYAYKIDSIRNQSEILWKYVTNGSIESDPIINGENVLFINDDNKLICLDKASGNLNCKFNTKGKAGISGVVVENGIIYTSVGKGYAFKLNEIN